MAAPYWKGPAVWTLWSDSLAGELHARSRGRLAVLFLGALFAQGRRTVTSWLRAAGVSADFAAYYYFLGALGRKAEVVATRLLKLLVETLPLPDRLLLVIDDTPTKRYGPKVEGADVHHNPTPGPADQEYLYGHVWVTLSLALRHAWWGALALPLQARLYVRQRTLAKIPPEREWQFFTKLALAARLVEWAAPLLQAAGKTVWVVADGFYAKRPFLERAMDAGTVVVSRLRKDAALFDLPPERRGRGRPRKYGLRQLSLAKRAGQARGWSTLECLLYGKLAVKTYKTFLATWRPAGGAIRVVLVKEPHGWAAFFCTDADASVAEILGAFADRATIEQDFHDLKEVWGAGQQQLRNIWANVAAYHVNLWMHTLVELWAWGRSHGQLCDRRASPWDDASRRPSHANRRRALRRQILEQELWSIRRQTSVPQKILAVTRRLLNLAA